LRKAELFHGVQQSVLYDLYVRLKQTRWQAEIKGSCWKYGSNLAYMSRMDNHRVLWGAANNWTNFATS
jgi:hypothetical protein